MFIARIKKCLPLLISVFFMQSCGVTYSGISGGMSGSSGGMSGSSGNSIRGMSGRPPNNQQGAGEGYSGETNAQRRARLEGELEESVGGLDEVLSQEQRKIESVGRDTEGFGGSGGRGGVGLGKQSAGGSQRGNASGQPIRNSNAAKPSIGGLSQEEIQARTPDDIPDLVSEDVVSKQLREAALSENDPKLRERLWEEYRNYNRF